MKSNQDQVNYFLFHAAAICYFTLYKELPYQSCVSRQFITALVSIPPHKFVLPSCLYYRLREIKNYDFRVDPYDITSILNFIQIRPAVLELNHANRQTDVVSFICVHSVRGVQRTRNSINGAGVAQSL
jgi:hypothetical protein